MSANQKTVAIDLDGTLAEYDDWKGWRDIGKPRPFARAALETFQAYGWQVTQRGAGG
jgi:histidinol phosphatase-like enzyme